MRAHSLEAEHSLSKQEHALYALVQEKSCSISSCILLQGLTVWQFFHIFSFWKQEQVWGFVFIASVECKFYLMWQWENLECKVKTVLKASEAKQKGFITRFLASWKKNSSKCISSYNSIKSLPNTIIAFWPILPIVGIMAGSIHFMSHSCNQWYCIDHNRWLVKSQTRPVVALLSAAAADLIYSS